MLTDILTVLAVFVFLGLRAVIWRLEREQTDQLRKAWGWRLFCLAGGPFLAAVNTGMITGFYGPNADHRFDWGTALRILGSLAALSALLFVISLGVRRVIRRLAGVA